MVILFLKPGSSEAFKVLNVYYTQSKTAKEDYRDETS